MAEPSIRNMWPFLFFGITPILPQLTSPVSLIFHEFSCLEKFLADSFLSILYVVYIFFFFFVVVVALWWICGKCSWSDVEIQKEKLNFVKCFGTEENVAVSFYWDWDAFGVEWASNRSCFGFSKRCIADLAFVLHVHFDQLRVSGEIFFSFYFAVFEFHFFLKFMCCFPSFPKLLLFNFFFLIFYSHNLMGFHVNAFIFCVFLFFFFSFFFSFFFCCCWGRS